MRARKQVRKFLCSIWVVGIFAVAATWAQNPDTPAGAHDEASAQHADTQPYRIRRCAHDYSLEGTGAFRFGSRAPWRRYHLASNRWCSSRRADSSRVGRVNCREAEALRKPAPGDRWHRSEATARSSQMANAAAWTSAPATAPMAVCCHSESGSLNLIPRWSIMRSRAPPAVVLAPSPGSCTDAFGQGRSELGRRIAG